MADGTVVERVGGHVGSDTVRPTAMEGLRALFHFGGLVGRTMIMTEFADSYIQIRLRRVMAGPMGASPGEAIAAWKSTCS